MNYLIYIKQTDLTNNNTIKNSIFNSKLSVIFTLYPNSDFKDTKSLYTLKP